LDMVHQVSAQVRIAFTVQPRAEEDLRSLDRIRRKDHDVARDGVLYLRIVGVPLLVHDARDPSADRGFQTGDDAPWPDLDAVLMCALQVYARVVLRAGRAQRNTVVVALAGRATVVRLSVARLRHRNDGWRERLPFQRDWHRVLLQASDEDLVAVALGLAAHREILTTPRGEGFPFLAVAADAQLDLGSQVPGHQVLVCERPIGDARSIGC